MRICVCGSQNVGKSTFIKDFIEAFPMYTCPETSYRDMLKEKNIALNRDGNQESQDAILNFIADQHMAYKSTDHVIHDRGALDNLIYSIYLNDKDSENVSEEFVKTSMTLCKEICKFYDIIFFIPILDDDKMPLEVRENRDTDPEYRQIIDMLFKAAQITYNEGDSMFFDMKDCPAFIEIFGNRQERVQISKFYLDPETGDQYPQEKTLLTPDLMNI